MPFNFDYFIPKTVLLENGKTILNVHRTTLLSEESVAWSPKL